MKNHCLEQYYDVILTYSRCLQSYYPFQRQEFVWNVSADLSFVSYSALPPNQITKSEIRKWN